MAGLKVKIGADASQFEATMGRVRGEIGSVKKAILGVAGATGAIFAVNKAFDAMKVAARSVFNEIKASSKVAADVEMMQVSFETLTGSAEESSRLMAVFRQEAQKSSLTLEDWATSARDLLSFGVESKDVVSAMKMIGDVSLGNSERFKFMTIAYAQVAAAGRLMGQEVRQMVNAGFNPLLQISERTGESMLDLKKRMEDGNISFDEVRQAFVDATSEGGRFYKAIDKGSATTLGNINKLKDNIFGLRLSFGEGFNDGLKVALEKTNDFLPKFEAIIKTAGTGIGQALAEAVNGDPERFIAIGSAIGRFIEAGIKAVMQKAGQSMLEGIGDLMEESIAPSSFGTIRRHPMAGKRQRAMGLGELFTQNLRENKAVGNLQNAFQTPQVAIREMQKPMEPSKTTPPPTLESFTSPFGENRAVMDILRQIARNTSVGWAN